MIVSISNAKRSKDIFPNNREPLKKYPMWTLSVPFQKGSPGLPLDVLHVLDVLMNPMMLLYGFIKHMYFTWIIKVFSFYTVKLLRFYYFYSFWTYTTILSPKPVLLSFAFCNKMLESSR